MRALQTAFAVAVIAVMGLACGREEEAAAPAPVATTPSPAVKGQLWRWVNVTVVIPEGSDLYVVQTSYGPDVNPPNGGPVLELWKDVGGDSDRSSSLLIDADTGLTLRDNVRAEHRAEIDAILKTLAVGPLDTATAPWPYTGELPNGLKRETADGIGFIRPSPETGLHVYSALNDPGGVSIGITNGKSGATVSIDPATGLLSMDTKLVLPDDQAVFERWLGAARPCLAEVPC